MSTARVPAGVPTGGQFATQAKPESHLRLVRDDETIGPIEVDVADLKQGDLIGASGSAVIVSDPVEHDDYYSFVAEGTNGVKHIRSWNKGTAVTIVGRDFDGLPRTCIRPGCQVSLSLDDARLNGGVCRTHQAIARAHAEGLHEPGPGGLLCDECATD